MIRTARKTSPEEIAAKPTLRIGVTPLQPTRPTNHEMAMMPKVSFVAAINPSAKPPHSAAGSPPPASHHDNPAIAHAAKTERTGSWMKTRENWHNSGEVARSAPAKSAPASPSHLRRIRGRRTTNNPHTAEMHRREKTSSSAKDF